MFNFEKYIFFMLSGETRGGGDFGKGLRLRRFEGDGCENESKRLEMTADRGGGYENGSEDRGAGAERLAGSAGVDCEAGSGSEGGRR